MTKPSPEQIKRRALASERHKARHFAMQGLYQWQLNATQANEISAQFNVDYNMKGTDQDYFLELLKGVQYSVKELDSILLPFTEARHLDECDPVTHALLRIATYELKNRTDVPYKVAINEAVNLAKKFGPEESHKFINGVLDQVAKQLRKVEVAAQ
jgi:N utilization substance protein B